MLAPVLRRQKDRPAGYALQADQRVPYKRNWTGSLGKDGAPRKGFPVLSAGGYVLSIAPK